MHRFIISLISILITTSVQACGTGQDTLPEPQRVRHDQVQIIVQTQSKKQAYRLTASRGAQSECFANEQGAKAFILKAPPYDLIAISANFKSSSVPYIASRQDVKGGTTIHITIHNSHIDVDVNASQ